MYRKLLTSAVFAGFGAGLIAALLQFYFVIPSLLEGEMFESGQRLHFGANGTPTSDRGAPPLGGDWARHLMTVGFNMVTYCGFGLILAGVMNFAENRGLTRITAKIGLLWGLCGFIVVQLAPAIGLPPELPGTIGAELAPRQTWWLGTLIASGVGLWLIVFSTGSIGFIGVALMALPHLIGAPHTEAYWGVAPPELAAEFVTLSLGAGAVAWSVLGFLLGYFWSDET